MSFTLHHGLDTAAKLDALMTRLARDILNHDHPIVLIAERRHAQHLTQLLLKHLNHSVLLDEVFMTWDDFLLRLVKKNLHRAHIARRSLCLHTLFLLLKTTHTNFLTPTTDAMPLARDLYNFHIQMKSCGIELPQYAQFVNDDFKRPELISLLETYQNILSDLKHFDAGDLLFAMLKLLQKDSIKLPFKLTSLHLFGLYPLHKGVRHFLRQFKTRFPAIDVEIFYDEDFKQKHSLLDFIYEDLGDLCDKQIHYANPHKSIPYQTIKHQFDQLDQVMEHIQTDLKSDYKPSQIAIVCLDSAFAQRVSLKLQQYGLPVSNEISSSLKSSLHPEASLPFEPATMILNLKTENTFIDQKLLCAQILEETRSNFEFEKTLLNSFFPDIVPELHDEFFENLFESLPQEAPRLDSNIVLIPLALAASYTHRKIYILDAALDHLLPSNTDQLMPIGSIKSPEFHELVASPNYRLHIQTGRYHQVINAAANLVILQPELDRAGKPLTPIAVPEHIKLVPLSSCIQSMASQHAVAPSNPSQDFLKTKKHTFSVSEVQEYLDCPYKYYLHKIVKLGDLTKDDIEPAANTKGSFVHKVLFELLKNNEANFLESLEYQSYRTKLKDTLRGIIDKCITDTEEFKQTNPEIVRSYANRVYGTISTLFDKESKLFKEKSKHTTPKKYYEWTFGKDDKHGLEIPTDFGTCTLNGQIDRIDVHHASRSFTVIDYKTGTPTTLTQIKQGQAIQLPVYVMVAEKHAHPGYQPSAAFFYNLKESKIQGLARKDSCDAKAVTPQSKLSDELWDEMMTSTLTSIRTALQNIHQGQFAAKPRDKDICKFCDYANLCTHRIRIAATTSDDDVGGES